MKNITYISAGAGSGKTYTLTTILAELISKDKEDAEHIEPEQVILTTFTKKAANEFREKAKAELYKRGKYDEAARLDHALIGTIDSVASALIQKYWYAIGMSPKQGVMDDNAKKTYINQSIVNIPSDDDLDFFAKFRKAFGVVDQDSHPNDNFWKDHLKDIVEKSISFDIDDYEESMAESLGILKGFCNGTTIHFDIGQRVAVLEALYSEVEQCRASGKKTTTLDAIDLLQKRSRYMEDIEWMSEFAKILKGCPSLPQNSTPIAILDDAMQKAVDLWRCNEVYALQEQYIATIFRLAKAWNEQYTQYKLNKRIVDFCDIEHYMHRLLQDKEVAAEIGRTYTHLFVDEFQDCSPIQVKIFLALADVVKQCYWVGDTKQAIYGFRGSDTELTKAVADAIHQRDGVDGCKSETLEYSWRSVPALVETSNRVFMKVFQKSFKDETERQVQLKPAMKHFPHLFEKKLEDQTENPLRYLNITEKRSSRAQKLRVADVAHYIKKVIDVEKVNPSDIAVLARTGKSLDDVQDALASIGIAADREIALDTESMACRLMMALITLTVNPDDDLAKAEIAYLTQDNMGVGAIIDSKLVYNHTSKEERTPWLGETEMIRRVNAIRQRVMYQGVGALMETLAVELDVKNIMARWDNPISKSMNDVKALILVAREYEKRSSELAQPATPAGFAEFLSENEVKLPIQGNGVQLLTLHGAKGLEWKYVFLVMDETLESKEVMSRDLYGIHHFHPHSLSADHFYPKMSIRVLPWIFGSLKNVPDSIAQLIRDSDYYDHLYKQCVAESARLLYVGMTRAAEVLVLVPWWAKKELDWFKRSGLDDAGAIEGGDVLGVGMPFHVINVEIQEERAVASKPVACRRLNCYSDVPSQALLRAVVPSGIKGMSNQVNVLFRSGQYITIHAGKLHGRDYSEVGNCIHNVYAVMESIDSAEVAQIILSHKMDDVLPNPDEIVRAWNYFQHCLEQTYGKPVAVDHERPFRQLKDNGQIVVGSIDYVYHTAEGVVLIDFKTFPQVAAITDPTSDHYAGHYAGQLDAYTEALEAAGEKVLKRLIYYPVSGMLVEVGPSKETLSEVSRNPKTYLLRWNPTISSFRIEDYRHATKEYPEGFRLNWSVYEWEEAHQGDRFYMLRTGDEHAGIVFRGEFTSDPYPGEDWAGKGKQRYYMDMDCYDCVPADQSPTVNIDALEKAIPNIDWRRGHSGQLLSEEDAEKLDELWNRQTH